MPNVTQSYLLMVFAWLIVLVATGVGAGLLYRFCAGRDSDPDRLHVGQDSDPDRLCVQRPICRPRRRLIVLWDGWMVLLIFFLFLLLPSLVQSSLTSSGFFHSLYGPDFPTTIPKEGEVPAELREAGNLRGLWTQFFAVPLLIVLILLGLRFLYDVRPQQLGLTRVRFSAHLVLGWLVWLVVTPFVFAVYFLAIEVLVHQPEQHGLTQLGSYAGKLEWAIFGIAVTVLAPCIEEILFRGVLLLWILKGRGQSAMNPPGLSPARRADACYVAAFLLAWMPLIDAITRNQRGTDWVRPLAPMIFLLATIPLYVLLPLSHWLRRRTKVRSAQEVRAIVATSILFAAVHNGVWPSPIPLFVLGLGLGYVTVRTRSLVPAILVHSLFNSVSAVYLLIGGQ